MRFTTGTSENEDVERRVGWVVSPLHKITLSVGLFGCRVFELTDCPRPLSVLDFSPLWICPGSLVFGSGHRFRLYGTHAFQANVLLEVTPSRLVPGSARAVLTLRRIVFQSEPAGNGEGLENRVFTCILLYP